ncbi:protein DEHYDRATION-INDUCED 19 homolog 3-like [Carica papaya]|uniref:protein DEHYDRATION-INDUCED 19 homolog 3-like n=1 Tax=Carica papaya TaxID=3649 RepID=UPI000B8CFEAC|nr:protein DEHYDRATION-INDUCED 19 homolog 3-like [Carica papaya]
MEDTWSYGLSRTSSSRSYLSALKSHSDFCIEFDEIEGDEEVEYPCPFCPEDYDLVGLCCHIDEEHPHEDKSGVCPVCTTIVESNMVGHIALQHGNVVKSHHRLKHRKNESHLALSYLRKELEDGHFRSLLGGSSPPVTSTKMAPDPLLSFIYNVPTANKSETVQPDSSSEVSLEEKSSDTKTLEVNVQLPSMSEEDHTEKKKRCEFVQGLLLSTIFDE